MRHKLFRGPRCPAPLRRGAPAASLLIFCAVLLAAHNLSAGQGSGLTAVAQKSPVPSELAAPISSQLSDDGVRVTSGAVTLDFWWVKALPMKAGSGAPSWGDVEEGALIGAVRLSGNYRDIRGRNLKPAVYTLRYGIQPSNGDHLGVSPFREFLLLSPATVDKDPAPQGHDGTVDLSKQSIGGSHPGVWSIDPPVATEAPLQSHKTELGHDAIIMQVPVDRGGQSGALKFGVVLVGKIEA
jgi:hypothetical protein